MTAPTNWGTPVTQDELEIAMDRTGAAQGAYEVAVYRSRVWKWSTALVIALSLPLAAVSLILWQGQVRYASTLATQAIEDRRVVDEQRVAINALIADAGRPVVVSVTAPVLAAATPPTEEAPEPVATPTSEVAPAEEDPSSPPDAVPAESTTTASPVLAQTEPAAPSGVRLCVLGLCVG